MILDRCGLQEDQSSLLRRKLEEEDYPVDITTDAPYLSPAQVPARDKKVDETGSVIGEWNHWWEEGEGSVLDDDSKVDWFMPFRLDERGRMMTGWEHLF